MLKRRAGKITSVRALLVLLLLTFVAACGMPAPAGEGRPFVGPAPPPAEVLAALPGTPTVVEHAVMPLNFACPNLILRGPGGEATGISDAMTPWSGAVAA